LFYNVKWHIVSYPKQRYASILTFPPFDDVFPSLKEELPSASEIVHRLIMLTTIILHKIDFVIVIYGKVDMHIISQFILCFEADTMFVECTLNLTLPLGSPGMRLEPLMFQYPILKANDIVTKVEEPHKTYAS
jgi:hypothetical protein